MPTPAHKAGVTVSGGREPSLVIDAKTPQTFSPGRF